MASIDAALLDLKQLDQLSAGESALHRLDPRAKVLTTLVFLACVVSFNKYELSALTPFFVFPAVLTALGQLPPGYLLRKVAVISPFALVVGIANPVLDTTPLLQLGPVEISGGWITCLSIVLRAMLTVSAAIILVALTGLPAICRALQGLGMPKAFTVQLLFLYRYLFVLGEEVRCASRAKELRSFGKKGRGLSSYSSMLGHLLMRTWQRAERIHMAMLARGFTGAFPAAGRLRFAAADFLFLLGWSALFIVMRLNNVPQLLASLLQDLLS